MTNSYKDLLVWQKGVELSVLIYKITNKFPKAETYGLIAQARRAAIIIPSNIAEGQGRKSPKEFKQFLKIALGSILELEIQLIISEKINYIYLNELQTVLDLSEQIKKMLYKLEKSL